MRLFQLPVEVPPPSRLFFPLSADSGVEGVGFGNLSKRNAGGFSVRLGGGAGSDTGECGVVAAHETNVNTKAGAIFCRHINGHLLDDGVAFFLNDSDSVTVTHFNARDDSSLRFLKSGVR